jgi:hypothetical protein
MDEKTLAQSVKSPQPSSTFEVSTEDSFQDRASLLKVGASLELSFLGGLVKVEGSANYLNEKKTSESVARVRYRHPQPLHAHMAINQSL